VSWIWDIPEMGDEIVCYWVLNSLELLFCFGLDLDSDSFILVLLFWMTDLPASNWWQYFVRKFFVGKPPTKV
jgi:hypothetical protein